MSSITVFWGGGVFFVGCNSDDNASGKIAVELAAFHADLGGVVAADARRRGPGGGCAGVLETGGAVPG